MSPPMSNDNDSRFGLTDDEESADVSSEEQEGVGHLLISFAFTFSGLFEY